MNGRVYTFLLGLEPTDVQPPLGQFQHTVFEKTDVRRLVGDINTSVQDGGGKALEEKILDEIFETYWPQLNDSLTAIQNSASPPKREKRPDRDILQEILEILRDQERRRAIEEKGDDMI